MLVDDPHQRILARQLRPRLQKVKHERQRLAPDVDTVAAWIGALGYLRDRVQRESLRKIGDVLSGREKEQLAAKLEWAQAELSRPRLTDRRSEVELVLGELVLPTRGGVR